MPKTKVWIELELDFTGDNLKVLVIGSDVPAPRARKRIRATAPPDRLIWPEMTKLTLWIKKTHPWAEGILAELVDSCFRYYESKDQKRTRWYQTVQNWISKEAGFRKEREYAQRVRAESDLRRATRTALERNRRRASDPDAHPDVRPVPEDKRS